MATKVTKLLLAAGKETLYITQRRYDFYSYKITFFIK